MRKNRLPDRQITTLAHLGHESAKTYLSGLRTGDTETAIKAGEQLVVLAKIAEREPDSGYWVELVRGEILQTAWDMGIPLKDVVELDMITADYNKMTDVARTSSASVRPSGTYTEAEVIYGFATGNLQTTVS